MAQDLIPPPSASSLAAAASGPISERTREYYTDRPCTEGQGCGGEGIVFPFESGNVTLDELFDFTDVETLPLSDEVLPVIFDGALLTEEGLLDCFARHYPERAAFLLQLLSDEGDLALGYRLEFLDDATEAASMRRALQEAQERYGEVSGRQAQLRGSIRSQLMGAPRDGGMGDRMAEGQNLESEAITLRNRIRDMDTTLSGLGRWGIDDNARVVRIYSTINFNVTRIPLAEYVPGAEDGINPLPTNKDGADWLYAVMGDWMARNGHPGAGTDEEFFRNWLTRNAAGVALVGLGAIEIFGGVTVAIGSGGLAAVGGVALTVVGFDTLSMGAKMLWTPNRHASERGWIGDLVHDTAMRFGSEEIAQKFDRGWAVTQILAGLGAPVVIRYAATRATRVAASGQNIRAIPHGQLDEARLGIAEIKGYRFGRGITGDYSPLPSGRGAVLNISGVGRFRAAPFESDTRLLLRLRRADIARMSKNHRDAISGAMASQRPVASAADARALVEEAAQHVGLRNVSRYVDEITVTNEASSYFTIGPGGQRILALSRNQMNSGGQFEKLVTAAHELNHARAFHILSTRTGMSHQQFTRAHFSHAPDSVPYVREEIIVETRAQAAIRSAMGRSGAKIDPEELNASMRYIQIHKDALEYFKKRGSWPNAFLRYYGLI